MTDQVLLAPQRSDRPSFRWRTRLEGSFYNLRLVWNSRAQRWLLDISDAVGLPIATGIGIVTGVDMLRPFADSRLPGGQLFARDESGRGRLPTRDGWRADFRLLYRTVADVAAAAGTDDEVR